MKYETANCALENRQVFDLAKPMGNFNRIQFSTPPMPTVLCSCLVALINYPGRSNLRKKGLTHGNVKATGV